MNSSNAKDYLPLVKALAEGGVIQMFSGGVWRDLGPEAEMFIDDRITYRIKPEPREIWMNYYPNGAFGQVHDSEVEAYEARSNDTAKQVRYREVIE